MKRTIRAILAAGALTCAMSLPAATQNQAQYQNQNHGKLQNVSMDEKEEHPNIQAAIKHLQEAKRNLENAAHDFGGHRASALKHVNEALEECDRALHYDKK